MAAWLQTAALFSPEPEPSLPSSPSSCSSSPLSPTGGAATQRRLDRLYAAQRTSQSLICSRWFVSPCKTAEKTSVTSPPKTSNPIEQATFLHLKQLIDQLDTSRENLELLRRNVHTNQDPMVFYLFHISVVRIFFIPHLSQKFALFTGSTHRGSVKFTYS
ncbi:unnamed protein product [Protopolystoma xenopodis]|uniref:Uncharacterized protein n=1 Tax=Protopolystoma xenopodis TaxID=117903 RepID=A0A3S5CNR1_9PLAT|nr:unnamed protein product [Protopolystoma xenopodis]